MGLLERLNRNFSVSGGDRSGNATGGTNAEWLLAIQQQAALVGQWNSSLEDEFDAIARAKGWSSGAEALAYMREQGII